MGKLICFLIGNGFNCMILDILKNEISRNNKYINGRSYAILRYRHDLEEIHEFLESMNKLITLWDEPKKFYDELLNELKKLNMEANMEESIGIIKCVIEYLHKIGIIDIHNKNYLHEMNERMIQRIIGNTTNKLIDFELNNGYKILGEAFDIDNEWFGRVLFSLLRTNNIVAHFYTTNYDGILDVLLMRQYDWYVYDGFNISKSVSVEIKNDKSLEAFRFVGFGDFTYFINNHLIAHLHGSYKFVIAKDGKIYKVKKSGNSHPTNYQPAIIYNSPVLKENIIKQLDVLNYYFESFKLSLQTCSKFVIWGNSLRTEPHIIEAICKNFDKEKPLYIIDKYPDSVIEQLQNGCKKHECEEFKNIKTLKDLGFNEPPKTKKELLDLFEKIITD